MLSLNMENIQYNKDTDVRPNNSEHVNGRIDVIHLWITDVWKLSKDDSVQDPLGFGCL